MQEFRLIQRIYRWNQSMQDEELPEVLSQAIVCPRDKLPLKRKGPFLLCPNGHDYPIVHGVPVLLVAGCEQTIDVANASLAVARRVATGETPEDPLFTATLGINEEERQGVLAEVRQAGASVDPVAKFMIGATNGILYRDLIGKIGEYPIPGLRLSRGVGKQLLDVGCNWGRWSVAAARLGYRAVGLDPSLGAVLAARRITKQLGLEAHFVVGDARFLPFASHSFDVVFSYSVIQHFSEQDARTAVAEVGRVLKPGRTSLIQMPNKFGLRCLFHQMRRRFRQPAGFEVRYQSIRQLGNLFSSAIGPTQFSADCFFGIGLQATDLRFMPFGRRCLIRASEFLRVLSDHVPILTHLADSLYIASVKPAQLTSD
jgi:SAM-dependent methyltransferase/uncharacterized protein YbaR (Trm112 family)